ncbi:TIGR04086 family membrane protein [Chamaesiphon sp. OTE_75_metabat_556]|uniref:TIGR04086 family membrane protein n=1 Tax=Chamaesiphon sp. OTE_75_metabat_556 TaxID=2964692 RepID=UPI00286B87A8|nr:TIGR04086 family membrane protein [Chamaesiphon sp. OTE_75_metabat_556]
MFSNLELSPIDSGSLQLAQIRIEPGAFVLDNPGSGSQLVVGLLAGIMMAFAFQLLLTNLSVALVATPGDVPLDINSDDDESLMDTVRVIETKVGIGVLITATIALFAASYLAVKFSLVNDAFLGALVGVTIWATYFTVLVWLGSNAVGSLLGSIVSTATSGLQGLMGATTGAIGANVAKNQAISTAEEITAAVRRELTTGFDPNSIQKTLQSSLSGLKLPDLDLDKIGSQFEKIVKDANIQDLATSDLLGTVNRQTFIDLVSNRTDLSKQDINQIADRLESTWKQVADKGGKTDVPSQLRDLMNSVSLEDFNPDELTGKLQAIVKGTNLGDGNGGSLASQALQVGLSALVSKVVQNANLSDLDVEKVATQVNKVKTAVLGASGGHPSKQEPSAPDEESKPFSVIQADLQDYLLSSPAWKLSQANVKQEFKDVVYDPQADPAAIRQQLEPIDRNYFVQTLSMRDDLQPDSIENLATYFDEARSEVLDSTRVPDAASVPALDLQGQAQEVRGKVEAYLRDTNKEELSPDGIERDLKVLFDDPKAGIDALKNRLSQFDRDTLVQLLSQRQDLDEDQVNKILDRAESVRQQVLEAPRQLTEQTKVQYEKTTAAIGEYLRNTNLEELNPDGIKRDLQTLLDDPKAGAGALRERLSQVDRETLVKLLAQQDNLTEEQVNKAVDQLQSAINSIVKAPRRLASRAKQQAVDFEANLENYLRNTHKEELNPDSIKRDLGLLLKDPRAGFNSLGDRVGQFDRSTFVALLSQREDISEEEANRIAEQVESSYRTLTEQFQKIQQLAQSAIDNLFGKVRDYLDSLDRPELNYEGIQADFSKLFDDPQAGFEALGDRLGQFDRDTLIAVLSSREDISAADAERIVAKIEETRDGVLNRAQSVQQEVKKRYKAVKRQAQQQAIETQKVAAGAAWWLFGTAVTSLAASAAAGVIAVNGFGVL